MFSLSLSSIIGFCFIGLGTGVLSGLLGIGGGVVLVPIFKLFCGFEPIVATATSLFTIIPTSVSGAITHVRNKTNVVSVGAAAGIGGALCSPVGVKLASISEGWMIMVATACVITYSAFTMFKGAFVAFAKKRAAQAATAPLGADAAQAVDAVPSVGGPQTDDAVAPYRNPSHTHFLQAGAIGMAAGLLSGYVGVGGGFLMVPLFARFLKLPMKLTSGTSLVAVAILAIPGAITQAFLGNVNWIAGLSIILGSVPGALLGAKLIKYVPENALRIGFGLLLVAGAALLFAQP